MCVTAGDTVVAHAAKPLTWYSAVLNALPTSCTHDDLLFSIIFDPIILLASTQQKK